MILLFEIFEKNLKNQLFSLTKMIRAFNIGGHIRDP